LCDPWIEPLLGHKLISLEDFRSKEGFSFAYIEKKKPEGKFVLNPIAEVMGYSNLKYI
jgi:hypothetical protein